MIDYEFIGSVMLPKPIYAQVKALQNETGASLDHIITVCLGGMLKQMEDMDTKQKKAALGQK